MHDRPIFLWLAIISMWFALVLGQMSECKRSGICAPMAPACVEPYCGDSATAHSTPAPQRALATVYEFNITGKYTEAESAARRLLATFYHDPAVHLNLAYARRGAGNYAGAIQAYRDALRLAEGRDEAAMLVRVDALTGLVACHLDAGNVDEAYEIYVKGAQIARRHEAMQKSDVSAYQLACMFAQGVRCMELAGKPHGDKLLEQAVAFLGVALQRGSVSARHLAGDLDLEPLRGDPAFETLVAGSN